MGCFMGSCSRCWGGKKAVLGLLVLANAYYTIVGWDKFIGFVLVAGGVMKLIMPNCPHCQEHMEGKKKK